MILHDAKPCVQRASIVGREVGEDVGDPAFMRLRHGGELSLAGRREFYDGGALVCGGDASRNELLSLERAHQPRDIAAGGENALGEFTHAQTIRCTLELCQQVEAWQRGAELALERAVELPFYQRGGGEQSQPESQ